MIAAGYGIGQRNFDDTRLRHDDRIFRIKQSQHGAALGRQSDGVQRRVFHAILNLLDGVHHVELQCRHTRFQSVNVIRQIRNRHRRVAEFSDARPGGKPLA